VTDLGVIFSFLGATSSTIVSLILPGAAYYNMHAEAEGGDQGLKSGSSSPVWKLYGALFILGLGCLITPVCLAFLFI
jgi:hypothetical protein